MCVDAQKGFLSHCHSQLDPVVGRMNQILLCAQVPFRGLNRRVSQEQLNLLKFTAGGPAQLGARSPKIMRRDTRNARCCRVLLEELPHNLL
jgi:hypothetical protein